MGVLNVTPDSFSDGGWFLDHALAVARGRAMIAEGACIVDVGGESTRPGAVPVDEDEEVARVIPVIEMLATDSAVADESVRISIDTRHAAVAVAAVAAGATIVNDVSASLYEVAAELGVGWVAVHMQGDPRTMQDEPFYDDVVAEVRDFLVERATAAVAAGVPEIWIDPGIGFGKTLDHNLALLQRISLFHGLGVPILLGVSRKRFIGTLSNVPDAAARAPGSVAVALSALAQGVQTIRAHDIAEHAQAIALWRACVAKA